MATRPAAYCGRQRRSQEWSDTQWKQLRPKDSNRNHVDAIKEDKRRSQEWRDNPASVPFDANNRDDLVFANVDGDSRVWTKNSGAGFTTRDRLRIGDAAAVAAADLTGNNRPDLVFGRVPTNIGDIPSNPVLINDGSGNFGSPRERLGISPTNDVQIGDVNRDGLPDLVFISASGVHQIWTLSGNRFSLHAEQIIDPGAVAGVLADLGFTDNNLPGGIDLAMGGAIQSGLAVYLNDSAGNLGRGDPVPPVLTLVGQPIVDVPARRNYADAGATALDNIDGDITARIVVDNPVNTSTVGSYTVTYNVQDFAGNPAVEISRLVNVIPSSGGGGGGGGTLGYWALAFLSAVCAVVVMRTRLRSRRIRITTSGTAED